MNQCNKYKLIFVQQLTEYGPSVRLSFELIRISCVTCPKRILVTFHNFLGFTPMSVSHQKFTCKCALKCIHTSYCVYIKGRNVEASSEV